MKKNSEFSTFEVKKVSNYLKTVDRQNPACISAVFTEESLTKILILAGSPQSFFNFSDGTLEYYYSFEPSNTQKIKTIAKQVTSSTKD